MKREFIIGMDIFQKENIEKIKKDIIYIYFYVSVYIPSIIDTFDNKDIVAQSCTEDSETCENLLISLKLLEKGGNINNAADLASKIITNVEHLAYKVPDYQKNNNFDKKYFDKWKNEILNIINS